MKLPDSTPIDIFSGQYRFLSNFYPSVVELDGVLYTSIEHAYQCAKINDPDIREIVSEIVKAGDVKTYVRVLLKEQSDLKVHDWNKIRLDTMEYLLCQKFQKNLLSKKLEATGDRKLVEGNTWHDNFYGDCRCQNKRGGHEECLTAGENHLGRILMKIRSDNRRTLFK